MAAWQPPEKKHPDPLGSVLHHDPRGLPRPPIRPHNHVAEAFEAHTDDEANKVQKHAYAVLTSTPNHSGEVIPVPPSAARKTRMRFVRRTKIKRGRPPTWAREVCLDEFVKRIPALCNMADGNYTRSYQVVTKKGKVVTLVETPSINERIKALLALGKLGGLESRTLLNKDGDDVTEQLSAAAVAGAVGMLAELAHRLAGGRPQEAEVASYRQA